MEARCSINKAGDPSGIENFCSDGPYFEALGELHPGKDMFELEEFFLLD